MNKSVYINITKSTNSWIIGALSRDIKKELISLGYDCKTGAESPDTQYDICICMSYAYAKISKKAKHNSVFVTHIDDKFKEILVKKKLQDFDSIICMSSDDAEFLISLGFSSKKVFGLPLPIRSSMVKPIKLGIFSACYEDGRKNEEWLVDYFNYNNDLRSIVLVFIGNNWGDFVTKLESLDLNFEWHRTSSSLHSEYEYQQNKLDNLDYYFYLGFDGGAMGTYDAYFRGINLIIAEGSYHEDIPDVENKITNYDDFKDALDHIIERQNKRINFYEKNSSAAYVKNLVKVWNKEKQFQSNINNKTEFLKNKRSKYSKLSLRRFASFIKQILNR